jgi:hypothetical protein
MKQLTTPPQPLDIEALFSDFTPMKRTTVRLHPRAAPRISANASKMGGSVLDDGSEWPSCQEHGCAFVPAIQLRAVDVPSLPMPDDKTVLQVLWCPFDHPVSSKRQMPTLTLVRTRWLGVADTLERPAQLRPPAAPHLVRECALNPETVQEYPSVFALPDDLSTALEDSKELVELGARYEEFPVDGSYVYQNYLGAAMGTKVGGHPKWIQGPQFPHCCGRPMEHLLSFASVEWHSARWRPLEEQDDSHDQDAGLHLGDNGYLYLFVCRDHPTWNTQAVFQTS